MLLNNNYVPDLTHMKQKAIIVLLSEAKSAITSKWKDSNSPMLTLWCQKNWYTLKWLSFNLILMKKEKMHLKFKNQ